MRRSRSLRHVAVLAVLISGACGPYEAPSLATLPPDELARHQAVGCWQFPAMRANPFLDRHTRVRLDTAALNPDNVGAHRLVIEATHDSALHGRIRVARWGALPANKSAVYLVWGDGFGGFAVEGVVRGDSLVGDGRDFTDFPAFSIRRRVTAVRVPCAPEEPALVVGFLDGGYPEPSGEGSPGEHLVIAAADTRFCRPALGSATTDSTGRFHVMVPGAVRTRWTLCIAVAPGSDPIYPVFQYQGRGTDSLQLYCRGHGPASGPVCQYVPWGSPFRWRGGETFDSMLEPPN